LKEKIMHARTDFYTASPDAMKAMVALEVAVSKLGLEPSLLELVKLRSSQINGCAFCVDMHTTDARKAGETDRRLHGVGVWRETPFFTPREQAALAWTEALTSVAATHAPDADYELLQAQFSPKEQVDLTLAINTINGWNRLGVGFRKIPAL
jgi:AhpD family alkylhydroperoxidase